MSTKKEQNHGKILFLTTFSLLLAIEIIVDFTPLGTLPSIGLLSATLSHIPVIIAALVLGMTAGAGMGLAFGICSFLYWSFYAPGPFSFIYTPFYGAGDTKGSPWSLLICFVPRILIGVVAAALAKGLSKTKLPRSISFAIAGAAGSLTNTVLVLSGIGLFFGDEYLSMTNAGKGLFILLGTTVLTNGLPEAALGAFAGACIALPVLKATKRYRK